LREGGFAGAGGALDQQSIAEGGQEGEDFRVAEVDRQAVVRVLEAERDIGDLEVELAAGVVLAWQAEEAKLGYLLAGGTFEAFCLSGPGQGFRARLNIHHPKIPVGAGRIILPALLDFSMNACVVPQASAAGRGDSPGARISALMVSGTFFRAIGRKNAGARRPARSSKGKAARSPWPRGALCGSLENMQDQRSQWEIDE
jgi:hypothetical protein